ncbi:MAG TPA: hypothetical protein VGA51_00035 [Casimicrobiaceae bacterium]
MTHIVTIPATRHSGSRNWSHTRKVVLTVIGCIAGGALMAVAQIAVGRMQTDILSAQASTVVGYMGSAPVVAQADVYFPARFRSRATRVEPLPAQ